MCMSDVSSYNPTKHFPCASGFFLYNWYGYRRWYTHGIHIMILLFTAINVENKIHISNFNYTKPPRRSFVSRNLRLAIEEEEE